jgi:hypothetical protein
MSKHLMEDEFGVPHKNKSLISEEDVKTLQRVLLEQYNLTILNNSNDYILEYKNQV